MAFSSRSTLGTKKTTRQPAPLLAPSRSSCVAISFQPKPTSQPIQTLLTSYNNHRHQGRSRGNDDHAADLENGRCGAALRDSCCRRDGQANEGGRENRI